MGILIVRHIILKKLKNNYHSRYQVYDKLSSQNINLRFHSKEHKIKIIRQITTIPKQLNMKIDVRNITNLTLKK